MGHEPSARSGEPRPGQHQPDNKKPEAQEELELLAAVAVRLAGGVKVGEQGDPGEKRDDPEDPRRGRGRSSTHTERRDPNTPERQTCGHDCGDRNADHDDRDVDRPKREVSRGQRRAREGDAVEQRSEEKEQDETEQHSSEGRHRRLHGRNHRDLPRRGTYEPHGGEALLSPGGGQPTGGRYQDEHGQQQGDRSNGQDPLQGERAASAALTGIATGRRLLDASDFDRPGDKRELVRVVADDDDQRVGRREAGWPDGSGLVSGKPLGQLVCRGRRQQAFERRRGVILSGSRQMRESRRDRRGWPRGGDIDPVDCLVAELVDAEQPPQRIRRRGARRPLAVVGEVSSQAPRWVWL